MKQNLYENNYASGGLSLVDIKGISRLVFTLEQYNSNGDIQKELVDKFKGMGSVFYQFNQNQFYNNDWIRIAYQPSAVISYD